MADDSVGLGQPDQATFAEIHDALLARHQRTARVGRLKVYSLRVIVVLSLLVTWQLAVEVGLLERFLVSDPISVIGYLREALTTGDFWAHTYATFQAVFLGLLVGATAGIALALALYEMPLVRKGVDPLLTFFNSLPRPALAPIFILWFGLGLGGKVSVAVSIVIFVLLLNTLAGLYSTDQRLITLADSLQMTRWQRLRIIQMPFAVPAIMAGLKLGAVYSVLGVVVAEMIASYEGLGQVLIGETNRFNMAGAFGTLITLGIFAMALNGLLQLLERRVSWQNEGAR